ncbi:MAG: dihydroflavonol 4-reductase [Bdellovibrionaceae bacterium]|nr:dihydroflavonol 4-reductase [Pseudobdellovibrionaceae bacterium]|tara:strand:+ start:92810 stop:93793 length:984 start_codon:yes stop_codon:yes gene_type:complete
MKYLVTGATGFVGSWVTRKLVEDGHTVRVLRRSSSDISELEGLDVQHCIGDITDLESLKKAAESVDNIFHIAGLVGYTKQARAAMEKVNVEGTRNVIQTVKDLNLGRLLHFSSVVAIGAGLNKDQILTEDSEFNISHLDLGYFETKRNAELLVKAAVDQGEIDAVMVNPSTIYGPGDAKKGSRKVMLKVAKGKFPIYTDGGVNVVSIHDVVEGTLKAFEKGQSGERYILAGDNITIKELFSTIANAAGVAPPSLFLPTPVVKALGVVGDILEKYNLKSITNSENAATATMFHWFSNEKSKKELGLQFRDSKSAIRESMKWAKENGKI